MNPYEILGVPRSASSAEIKAAYRRLVKLYHPDVVKGVDHGNVIVQLNEAYDILSDPRRKMMYDQGPRIELVYEESPAEIYRRNYINRKKEEARRRREANLAYDQRAEKRERIVHKVVRIVTIPIVVFAIVLVADCYLPGKQYDEVAEMGWQERVSRRSSGDYMSYMQTRHFTLAVPGDVHLDYDYWADRREVLHILATPFFQIPKTITLSHQSNIQTFVVSKTLYSTAIPFHFLLLFSALYTLLARKYSKLTYSLCFLPLLILGIVLLIMW